MIVWNMHEFWTQKLWQWKEDITCVKKRSATVKRHAIFMTFNTTSLDVFTFFKISYCWCYDSGFLGCHQTNRNQAFQFYFAKPLMQSPTSWPIAKSRCASRRGVMYLVVCPSWFIVFLSFSSFCNTQSKFPLHSWFQWFCVVF